MMGESILLLSGIIGLPLVGFVVSAVNIYKQKRELKRLERNQERIADMWRLYLKHGMGMDTYEGVSKLLEELERDEK